MKKEINKRISYLLKKLDEKNIPEGIRQEIEGQILFLQKIYDAMYFY